MGEMVMMTLGGWEQAPSLQQAAEQLHVAPEALDPTFGVVLVDPARHIFTVRVDRSALADAGTSEKDVNGPFADPGISTFGPPE
jgi:hypothetical protein